MIYEGFGERAKKRHVEFELILTVGTCFDLLSKGTCICGKFQTLPRSTLSDVTLVTVDRASEQFFHFWFSSMRTEYQSVFKVVS